MTLTRFAPSPTGLLHLGHAYSAWLSEGMGQRFLLRLEDIDIGRCRSQFVEAILRDLAWLGLRWADPIWRQSQRLKTYSQALEQLQATGLIYPCFCTRKDIADQIARSASAPHGPDGPLYPGTCRRLPADARAALLASGRPHAWRLDTAAALARVERLTWTDRRHGVIEARPERLGDVVLARKDVPTSYHLAVVIDDAAQHVDLVVRGMDLFESTHMHRLLQALLDLPVPAYHHHGLITDSAGRRLAKRHDAQSLQALREAGRTPEQVRSELRGWAERLGDLPQGHASRA
ncbi:MAG: tRNA glutamyl-Q(34) synthetase GluQRS [Rhodothalassiaceae bacterium]